MYKGKTISKIINSIEEINNKLERIEFRQKYPNGLRVEITGDMFGTLLVIQTLDFKTCRYIDYLGIKSIKDISNEKIRTDGNVALYIHKDSFLVTEHGFFKEGE